MAGPFARCAFVNCAKFPSKCSRYASIKTILCNNWRGFSSATLETNVSQVDPEEVFIRNDVQSILKKITGFSLDKIFKERQTETDTPKYKLLTDQQLHQLQDETIKKGYERLQMPPVKKPWTTDDTTSKTLSSDPDIAHFDDSNCPFVFTDISYGLPNKLRVVVVREPNGTLRLAGPKERDRTLQVYFPRPGRMYNMPKMFEEQNLEKVLREFRYEYSLDRACVQFEPDDPDYIRVTQRTYEHIAASSRYEDLWSTRHFGPMAFHFAMRGHIDGLLVDMMQRDRLQDAYDLVRLYHIIHPDCVSANEAVQPQITDPQQVILLFAKHDALHGGVIELAVQSYNESRGGARERSKSMQ